MSTKSKKEISCRQIGLNMVVVIDGEQYSKKVAEAKDRELIKEKVKAFNAKNTVTLQKEIISIFNKKTEESKKKVEKTKALGKKISKAEKKTTAKKELMTVEDFEKADKLSDDDVKRLENLLAKHKKTEAPVENKRTTRRGEY